MSATLGQAYLESVIKRLLYYKTLGDMTFTQLEEKDFHFVPVTQPAFSAASSPSTAPHHVGQIVYIGKMIRGFAWQSLSIPKGASDAFNQFMQDKRARR